jgi:hypothetical protein
LRPFILADVPVKEADGELVVTVRKNVGLHIDKVTDDSLDGESAVVDLRIYVFDNDAGPGYGIIYFACNRRHNGRTWQNACPFA